MNSRFLNKVKVVQDFPGFKSGDVLMMNTSTGLFEYAYNENDVDQDPNSGISAAFNELTKHKPSLSKDDVMSGIPEFLMDISEYEMKSKDWMEDRMVELKKFITNIDEDSKEGLLSDLVNVKEAKTVWQNLIWEYETILGMRKSFRSDL